MAKAKDIVRSPALRWVEGHADGRALVLPHGPIRFALRLTVLIVAVAVAATVVAHAVIDAFGLLPYPLLPALAVGTVVSFTVSGAVGFATLLIIGNAIRDLAINRDDFRRLSSTDHLSGLLNRRAFFQRMEEEPIAALLLFDIDHFKSVNDRYGHSAGDEVIRYVSRCLADGDGRRYVGRLGGEEFGILLADQHARAFAVAEGIRSRVAADQISTGSGGLSVTVSGGVAYPRGQEGSDALFRRCDEALYRAKRSGRNRVVQASRSDVEKGYAAVG